METVSLKLDDTFARDLERMMRKHRYTTKTEFIREALRDKMRDLEIKERLTAIERTAGSSKLKTTDAQLHKVREEIFDELERKFRI